MHARQRRIVTASKDGSVAVAELGADGGVRLLRRWGDHHAGVAKCARWRGQVAQVFASCGNDRRALARAVISGLSCWTHRLPVSAPGRRLCQDIVSADAPSMCRCIRVTDMREAPSAHAGACLPHAHGAAVNCLRWHPLEQHMLLSAAAEPAAHLWDLRAPALPLHALIGHIAGRHASRVLACAGHPD